MKTLFIQLPVRLFSFFTFVAFWFISASVWAQRPKNIPHPEDSEPLALDSIPKILIYIGLPVLFFLLYLWVRSKKTKDKN